jgi:hypothetical protein
MLTRSISISQTRQNLRDPRAGVGWGERNRSRRSPGAVSALDAPAASSPHPVLGVSSGPHHPPSYDRPLTSIFGYLSFGRAIIRRAPNS